MKKPIADNRLKIAVAMAATAVCCLRSEWEKKHFVTTEYTLKSEKAEEEKTFVFLSDLHDNCFGQGQKELLAAIRRTGPDGVLIGGDMMVVKKRADIERTLALVRTLARRYPVYYGNGNHENRMDRKRNKYGDRYDVLVRELQKAGVCHLSDTGVCLPGGIALSGLNLQRRHYRKMADDSLEVSYIEERLGKADSDRYQILLAHSPLYRKTYAQWGADLTLAGHFHGGTIRIPGLGGLMTPQFHFFRRCCGGLLRTGQKTMIVSRGLGTHSVNVRLNNRPELVVVHIMPAFTETGMSATIKEPTNTQEKRNGGDFL